MTIKLRILLCLLLLEVTGYGLVLMLNYQGAQRSLTAVREQQIAATLLGYLHKINAQTGALERNAIDLASAGERYQALREELAPARLLVQMEQHLLRNFERFPDAIGGGWWYEPQVFDPQQRYFGPYAFRDQTGVRFTWDLSQPEYDYLNQSWYLHALPQDWPRERIPETRVVWTEPYFDEAGSMALMMTVDALMISDARRIIGMATVDWSTEGMRALVSAIKVTPGSFSFLIDRHSGRFVSFVADQGQLMQPAKAQPWAAQVLAQARTGELRHSAKVAWHGRDYRVYFIGTDIGLILGSFIPEDEVLAELLPVLRRGLLLGALVSIFFISAMALALSVLFRPFQRVLRQISHSLRHEHGKLALTPLEYAERNEFTPLVAALNEVYRHMSAFTASLAAANDELEATHQKVNELNVSLERKVAERTEELARNNEALQRSVTELRETQQQLVEAEKHAALNQLVAGVAHEVNTPLGVAVTAASYLRQELSRALGKRKVGEIPDAELEACLGMADEALAITMTNLERAATLVKSFKQISVDQSSEAKRSFALRAYIEDILLSLNPTLRKTPHKVVLDCPEDLTVTSYPGALAQVLTNLVLNALLHAFPERVSGTMSISVRRQGAHWLMRFADDGRGIPAQNLPHVFEPFFTTRRGQGGSGLGLHIVYNLVTQTLHGRIRCESTLGAGTVFTLEVPIEAG